MSAAVIQQVAEGVDPELENSSPQPTELETTPSTPTTKVIESSHANGELPSHESDVLSALDAEVPSHNSPTVEKSPGREQLDANEEFRKRLSERIAELESEKGKISYREEKEIRREIIRTLVEDRVEGALELHQREYQSDIRSFSSRIDRGDRGISLVTEGLEQNPQVSIDKECSALTLAERVFPTGMISSEHFLMLAAANPEHADIFLQAAKAMEDPSLGLTPKIPAGSVISLGGTALGEEIRSIALQNTETHLLALKLADKEEASLSPKARENLDAVLSEVKAQLRETHIEKRFAEYREAQGRVVWAERHGNDLQLEMTSKDVAAANGKLVRIMIGLSREERMVGDGTVPSEFSEMEARYQGLNKRTHQSVLKACCSQAGRGSAERQQQRIETAGKHLEHLLSNPSLKPEEAESLLKFGIDLARQRAQLLGSNGEGSVSEKAENAASVMFSAAESLKRIAAHHTNPVIRRMMEEYSKSAAAEATFQKANVYGDHREPEKQLEILQQGLRDLKWPAPADVWSGRKPEWMERAGNKMAVQAANLMLDQGQLDDAERLIGQLKAYTEKHSFTKVGNGLLEFRSNVENTQAYAQSMVLEARLAFQRDPDDAELPIRNLEGLLADESYMIELRTEAKKLREQIDEETDPKKKEELQLQLDITHDSLEDNDYFSKLAASTLNRIYSYQAMQGDEQAMDRLQALNRKALKADSETIDSLSEKIEQLELEHEQLALSRKQDFRRGGNGGDVTDINHVMDQIRELKRQKEALQLSSAAILTNEAVVAVNGGHARDAQEAIGKLRQECGDVPAVRHQLSEFERSYHDSDRFNAAAKRFLEEFNSESLAVGVGVPLGAGAVGAGIGFCIGGPPGAGLGFLIGSAVGLLGVKSSNIVMGWGKIQQAYETGYTAISAEQTLWNGVFAALDVAQIVAPGVGAVKTAKGLTALTPVVGKNLFREMAENLAKELPDVGRDVLEKELRESILNQWTKHTASFGGKGLALFAGGALPAAIGRQVYLVESSDMTTSQKERAYEKMATETTRALMLMIVSGKIEGAMVRGGTAAQSQALLRTALEGGELNPKALEAIIRSGLDGFIDVLRKQEFAHLRTDGKVAGEPVALKLGKREQRIELRGGKFEGRVKTTEDGEKVVFLNEENFAKYKEKNKISADSDHAAFYDHDTDSIVVLVPNSGNKTLPSDFSLSATDAEKIRIALAHESLHRGGATEFEAYTHSFKRLHELGLIKDVPTHAEILDFVFDHYDAGSFKKAFTAFASKHNDDAFNYLARFDDDLPLLWLEAVEAKNPELASQALRGVVQKRLDQKYVDSDQPQLRSVIDKLPDSRTSNDIRQAVEQGRFSDVQNLVIARQSELNDKPSRTRSEDEELKALSDIQTTIAKNKEELLARLKYTDQNQTSTNLSGLIQEDRFTEARSLVEARLKDIDAEQKASTVRDAKLEAERTQLRKLQQALERVRQDGSNLNLSNSERDAQLDAYKSSPQVQRKLKQFLEDLNNSDSPEALKRLATLGTNNNSGTDVRSSYGLANRFHQHSAKGDRAVYTLELTASDRVIVGFNRETGKWELLFAGDPHQGAGNSYSRAVKQKIEQFLKGE